MGKRGPKPRKSVNTRWSEELAYVVGLIATDGCLLNDGRHLEFNSKDKALVHTFRECLNLKNRIGKKTSGYTGRKDYYRIQFGDVHFHGWLRKIGLMPRKSKTLGGLKIPTRYFFDFLRGCFDGDGTIYSYWDPRWHSSYMFYISFVSASLPHLQWLEHNIRNNIGFAGKIGLGSRSYQLRYAKTASRILLKKMFYKENVQHLQRKFLNVKRILNIDDNHSKAQMAESVYAAA